MLSLAVLVISGRKLTARSVGAADGVVGFWAILSLLIWCFLPWPLSRGLLLQHSSPILSPHALYSISLFVFGKYLCTASLNLRWMKTVDKPREHMYVFSPVFPHVTTVVRGFCFVQSHLTTIPHEFPYGHRDSYSTISAESDVRATHLRFQQELRDSGSIILPSFRKDFGVPPIITILDFSHMYPCFISLSSPGTFSLSPPFIIWLSYVQIRLHPILNHLYFVYYLAPTVSPTCSNPNSMVIRSKRS